MTLVLSVWIFFTSSLIMLTAIYTTSNLLLVVGASLMLLTGVHIGLVMGVRLYVYTASLFIFHLVITMLVVYIYLNRDLVIPSRRFVYSTFTDENLRTALVVFTTTLISVLLPWSMMVRRKASLQNISLKKTVIQLVGSLDFLKKVWIQTILLVSLLSAVILVYTNTTVLDVKYPYNSELHWIPKRLLGIPLLLATIGILTCYYKYVQYGLRYYLTLSMARFNFVITPVLMILLIGARGYLVFMWLFVGILEFYLFLKRRGSLLWCIIFIAFAYFTYQSWPYLRGSLASIPVKAALVESLNIALFSSGGTFTSLVDESGIHIQNFTRIGMALFHMLYSIQLINDGISLGGSTFINLIPQALPSFLDGILWDRPIHDEYKLEEYYYHGGGFLIVANAYWNGGLAVTVVFVLVLSVLFIGFDSYLIRHRTSILYKFMYWLMLPLIILQLGYGIQGLARVVEILAVSIIIDKIKWRRKF